MSETVDDGNPECPAPTVDVHVLRLRARPGRSSFRGRVDAHVDGVRGATLKLVPRSGAATIDAPVTLQTEKPSPPELASGQVEHRWYRFEATVDWTHLWADGTPLSSDVYDAWLVCELDRDDQPFWARVGKTRFLARMLTDATSVRHDGRAAAVTPYYTMHAGRTSFRVEHFDADALAFLRRRMRTRVIDRALHRMRRAAGASPVWIVGELPYKAQDTGLALFRYLRANRPDVDAYYVIEPDSPEYRNVAGLGNVVDFRSRDHIRLTLLADRIVGSHHPDWLYPTRAESFAKAVRAPRIFLQHGVMAIKWMTATYGRDRPTFDTDLFIVSSEREKRYIVSDFGYAPSEVVVTGLTRFDTLFDGEYIARRQILVMPTWRPWLLDARTYIESDYHQHWFDFLSDPAIRNLPDREGVEVVFCLHPNVQVFSHLYEATGARVVNQGDVDIQQLLKESALLVTDFSSVGFDFAFLDKPVIFYQFDRKRTLGRRGAHIDLDNELPGDVVQTHELLIAAVQERVRSGFRQSDRSHERASRFIAYRDRHNSERVAEAVETARRRRLRLSTIVQRRIPAAAIRFWRRSSWYHPSMRTMFRVLRRLPADERRVVFEAGLGRQYADSPRYIYEELLRSGPPMRSVWSYSGKIHTADPALDVVPRLSVRYYWHLGRAKYWVNSQNFPYQLTRRRGGVFVQTWHGTPLKRMLRDVTEVHGRDEGYVDRMSRAARQWSLLVAPSDYAARAIADAYGYEGGVPETGYPRHDLLLADDRDKHAKEIRDRLEIPADASVVLYAPTFRDNLTTGRGRFAFDLPFDLHRVVDALPEGSVLLLRTHVVVNTKLKVPSELATRARDVSDYGEVQDLLLISDALVTDYSSLFFDYALLRRPMVFYAYDLDDYRDRLRGFYLDYPRDVPGPVVTTEPELLAALADLDAVRAAYADGYEAFVERFAPHDDGHASARVVQAVFGGRGGSSGRFG